MSWDVVKFSEITDLITCGVAKRPEYVDDGVPFLSAKNVKNGEIVYKGYNCISEETHAQLTKHNKPTIGDILYTRVGSVGEAAIVESDIEFSVFVSLTLIKPKHDLINNKYLKYLLNSAPFKERALGNLTGIGVGNLNVSVVRNFPIPLPPLPIQKKIAEALEKADKLRQLRQEQLNKLDELLQSTFLDMFGDPVQDLGKIAPKGWVISTIGDQVTLQRGKDITKSTVIYGNIPVISSGGVSYFHNTALVKGPGVLLGRKGSVGKVHFVNENYWPHDTTLYVKEFNNNCPVFVYHFFKQFPISNYELSSANPSLNRNNIHPVKVLWPPVMLQEKFKLLVKKTDEEKLILGQLIKKSNLLFNSLIQKAFKGELAFR